MTDKELLAENEALRKKCQQLSDENERLLQVIDGLQMQLDAIREAEKGGGTDDAGETG